MLPSRLGRFFYFLSLTSIVVLGISTISSNNSTIFDGLQDAFAAQFMEPETSTAYTKKLSESLTTTDAKNLGREKAISEKVGLADSKSKHDTIVLAEIIAISDGPSIGAQAIKNITDSLMFAYSNTAAFSRKFDESAWSETSEAGSILDEIGLPAPAYSFSDLYTREVGDANAGRISQAINRVVIMAGVQDIDFTATIITISIATDCEVGTASFDTDSNSNSDSDSNNDSNSDTKVKALQAGIAGQLYLSTGEVPFAIGCSLEERDYGAI